MAGGPLAAARSASENTGGSPVAAGRIRVEQRDARTRPGDARPRAGARKVQRSLPAAAAHKGRRRPGSAQGRTLGRGPWRDRPEREGEAGTRSRTRRTASARGPPSSSCATCGAWWARSDRTGGHEARCRGTGERFWSAWTRCWARTRASRRAEGEVVSECSPLLVGSQ